MARGPTTPGAIDALLWRLVPLAALLGSPCCGTGRAIITFSAREVDGGLTTGDGGVVPAPGGGALSPADCQRLCSQVGVQQVYGCSLAHDFSGAPAVRCDVDYNNCHEGAGRRPAGLADAPPARAAPAGAWLAEAARLEAASVHAFVALRAELAAHGAPAALQRAAGRAARDEVRHARQMSALARRYGATPAPAVVAPTGVRPLAALAAENAAEGCVRETYGALVAAWQSRAAADPAVRAAMRAIARDEARHAALAWRVAAWAHPRLDRAARARVADARRAAVAALRGGSSRPRDPALSHALGVPCGAHAGALAALLDRALWAA